MDRVLDVDEFLMRAARDLFALDRRIRWVAFEEPGRPSRWVSRDPVGGTLWIKTGSRGNELLDPMILVLAEEREADSGHGNISHPLRFLILAYDDLVQVAARCGVVSFISAGIDPAADACALANELASLAATYGRAG